MLKLHDRQPTTVAPTLLERLGETLDAAGVACCQWKGHWKRERWETGGGDVDLLVDPTWAEQLESALDRLGFKPAVAPPEAQVPGTASWVGYDVGRGACVRGQGLDLRSGTHLGLLLSQVAPGAHLLVRLSPTSHSRRWGAVAQRPKGALGNPQKVL